MTETEKAATGVTVCEAENASACGAKRRAVLTTDKLSVGYRGKAVIDGVTVEALPGRIMTLIGPNGAGKSTIIKTLIRQLVPVDGTVTLLGRDMDSMTDREIARNVSAVLTTRPRPELMTCADVVATGRYPYTGRLGILSEHDREIAARAMEAVQVTELRDRDFNRISDGQRQRVMLARAICQEPKLLIMDEPTSFLDIRHKLDFLHLLRRLVRETGLAVLLSLHELDLAQRFSDIVICVREGRIDRIGPPEQVFFGDYVSRLYGVEQGCYDPLYGSVEAGVLAGAPQVFVLGGGGYGIPLYRMLRRMGVPFAAGVFPESDLDVPAARSMAAEVFTVPAFMPVDSAAVTAALETAERCRALVCPLTHFGEQNRACMRILNAAEEKGILTPQEKLEELLVSWKRLS